MGCMVIGIAGGSGAGKTELAWNFFRDLGSDRAVVVELDWYYRDLSMLDPAEREKRNFDHPDALDFGLLHDHIDALRAGQSIEAPQYDYRTHTRLPETRRVEPRPVIILEGILLLAGPEVRPLLDIKVFVDADVEIRFNRRARRDLEKRGRSWESIVSQFQNTVEPMHAAFVEPSRRFADLVLSGQDPIETLVKQLRSRAESLLREEGEVGSDGC